MKKDKLAWCLSWGLILLGLFCPLFVSVFVVRNCLDQSQPLGDSFEKVVDQELGTSFVANHDYLNIVILSLKNPGLANQGDYLFSLKEGDRVLVERQFSGFNVGDPSSVRFQFEPIAGTKGKELSLSVKALSVSQPEISIASSRKHGLSFVAYYRNLNKKEALISYLNHLLKIFVSDWPFFIFWLSLLSFLLWLKKISY